MSLTEHTLCEHRDHLDGKRYSAVELANAYLERIAQTDEAIGSYLHVCREIIKQQWLIALRQARAADDRLARGERTALLGIPIGLKDIFLTAGIPTTCASRILEGYVPPYTATSAQKLLDAGAVLLGKLNMDEFAMGSSTETSHFKITRNPWDLERIPGGSSGGSASSVAARQCVASLGTDPGGSIRQPAALCGVVGLKPTYGRVSRYGVIAFASSLDQVGPFARTVGDCALMLSAIAGYDSHDSTSSPLSVPDYSDTLGKSVAGLRLGIPAEYFGAGIDSEVKAAVEAVIRYYEGLGVICKPVNLPHTEYALATYYIIAPAEASSNLARYDGIRFGFRDAEAKSLREVYDRSRSRGFGPEVTRRIMLGTYVLSAGYYEAYYRKAQKVRTLIKQDFDAAFAEVDAIITPVAPTPAFKIGEKTSDPVQMYLSDVFTIPVNMAGLPGLSVPCGFTTSNLPLAFQLIGKPFDEATLLQLGHAYQQGTDWHRRVPAVA